MSASARKELDSIATCFVSTESPKRPRSCDTDDDEDAGLLRRKRAIAATSKQPDEEPQVTPKTRSLTCSNKGTGCYLRGRGLNWTRSPANTKDADEEDSDDVSMLDCSISSEMMNGMVEVQEPSENLGETCFGAVSILR